MYERINSLKLKYSNVDKIFWIFCLIFFLLLVLIFFKELNFFVTFGAWIDFVTSVSVWFLLISGRMVKYYSSDIRHNMVDTGVSVFTEDEKLNMEKIKLNPKIIEEKSDFKVYLLIHYAVFLIGVIVFYIDQLNLMSELIGGFLNKVPQEMFNKIILHPIILTSNIIILLISFYILTSYKDKNKMLLKAYKEHNHTDNWGIPPHLSAYLRIIVLISFIFISFYSSYYKFLILSL
ncbi:MAG: hypothetical protein DRG78_02000 [Epsilonproteobacteria bacterium]|nr:MAG: hypothetical protein DRG78_02000 [Campylobacterota bacterium]